MTWEQVIRMEKHIFLALKQGGIGKKDAERIMKLLSKETLYRITENKFDKRLIRPVLKEADKLIHERLADDDEENVDLETAVKQVLNNKKEMFVLMKEYCLDI